MAFSTSTSKRSENIFLSSSLLLFPLDYVDTCIFSLSQWEINPQKENIYESWSNEDQKAQKKNTMMSVELVLILMWVEGSSFGAVQKPDFGRIVCKTYIFINSNLLSYKNWKQN